jgi:protease I
LFDAQGWTVNLVSTKECQAKGMLGAVETVDMTFEEVEPCTYQALVIVGGMGSPQYLWNNQTLHSLARELYDCGRVVSAICLSGAVLANAGLLQGKQATVWEMPESLEALKKGGAIYTGEPVTEDGRIVTANGPEAAMEFGQAVIRQVSAILSTPVV